MTAPPEPSGEQRLRESWFERYLETFFSGDALQAIVCYMCNSCTMEIVDPVCSTLAMFVSTPVIFCLSNAGLMPFKNMSMAVFPYANMTNEQRVFLLEYIAFIREQEMGVASTQMGGGCVLSVSKKYGQTHSLDHVVVLGAFLSAVLAHEGYKTLDARLSICNIVLQRLGATVALSRESVLRLHQNVLKPARAREQAALEAEAAHAAEDRDGGAEHAAGAACRG